MEKYKRLTYRDNGNAYYHDYVDGMRLQDWQKLERLAELEDKIDQGTLIELPCKEEDLIGQTVYGISKLTSGGYIYSGQPHTVIGFCSQSIVVWNDIDGYIDYFWNDLWFLTKEQAEQRLKELQGVRK